MEHGNEYVYIISNPTFPENTYKIGYTKDNDPTKRISSLHTSGIIEPFTIEYLITTPDAPKLETAIHNHLKNFRINEKREFFQILKKELYDILTNELALTLTPFNECSVVHNKNWKYKQPPKIEAKICNDKFHCCTCNIPFRDKYTLNKHLNTTKHKLNVEGINWYYCDCGKKYQYKKSRKLHQTTCKIYSENNRKKEQESIGTKKLELKINELTEKTRMLEEQIKNKETIHVNNTINNSSTLYDDDINVFGNENIYYVKGPQILECVMELYKSIPAMVEKIYFDPNHPENHNVKITNKKLPYASVIGSDKKWKIMKQEEVIDQMVNKCFSLLNDTYRENRTKLSENEQKQFDEYTNKYVMNDKKTIKDIKYDVKILIINHSKK